jgi:hypothetical protein
MSDPSCVVADLQHPKRRRARAAPSPNAMAFTLEDAQAMGAPGRTKIYALAKQHKLKLLKVAGRTMVDGQSLRALLSVGF